MHNKLTKNQKVIIRFLGKTDITGVVKIHREVLYEGIAAILGPSFLQVLYRRLITRELGFCIVAEKNGKIVGLCVGLLPGAVWKLGWAELMDRNWEFIVDILLLSLVKNPPLLIQFIMGRKKQPKNIELYFLGVTLSEQGKGIGDCLINRFGKELLKMGQSRYFLITWTGGEAEKFYFREGFTKLHEANYLGRKISYMGKDLI